MTAFEWNESYMIGVKRIDKHNQYLFKSMTEIYKDVNELPGNKNINLAFSDLSNYIDFHFACEEIWMVHSKYGLVSEHSEQHRQIILAFYDIYDLFQRREISVATMLSFFIETVITHIQTSDAGYGQFVTGKLPAS